MDIEPVHAVDSNGEQTWRVDGKLHREDGPAIIWVGGTQVWYVNDQLHRIDGPALIRASGTREWYINGQRHRIDGPAIIRADGRQHWLVNGKNITDEVEQWAKEREITWPWDDEAQVEFLLTWT